MPDQRVAMVGTDRPVAFDSEAIEAAPLNTTADGQPIMIFRASPTAGPRAMVRRVGDLRPQFHLRTSADAPTPRHARLAHGARPILGVFVDADTGSGWTGDGVWVSGPTQFKGIRLATMPIDDDLDWRVMKYWYPDLKLVDVPRPATNALAVGE